MTVRIGVIGTGNIGSQHIALLMEGGAPAAALAATASRSSPRMATGVPHYADYREMLASGGLDAVLIATPTLTHQEVAEVALQHNLHILMEKPLAMSVGQALSLVGKTPPDIQFAVMLNQRFHPVYRKLKQLLADGYIGELMRVHWTMTAWYRPDIYYQASSWRGTWPGEGGGLLINQCIHNLDVLQWLVGLPVSVTSRVGFGKYHDIDVEDEAFAILAFASGATGTLVASSGEAPGINHLELVGDMGRLVSEGNVIYGSRASESVLHHCKTTREMFGSPEFTSEEFAPCVEFDQHAAVIQNFSEAIESDVKLLTPAEVGLESLQLANGILLSAWTGSATPLPIDAEGYESELQARIGASTLREAVDAEVEIDMRKSYR